MSSTIGNQEVFEHFSELPLELKMTIVDEMRPADRCRFSRSSTLSNIEAKMSKNYVYGLGLFVGWSNDIHIEVIFGKSENYVKDEMAIKFVENNGANYMRCTSRFELWTDELEKSINTLEFAVDYFKDILKKYQRKIKWLRVQGEALDGIDFEARNMMKLEELLVQNSEQCMQFLSKRRFPIKKLRINDEIYDEFSLEKLSQTRDQLWMPNLKINYEQMLRLSASTIEIHIGELTVEQVVDFFRCWQNGTHGQDIKHLSFNLRDHSSFGGMDPFC